MLVEDTCMCRCSISGCTAHTVVVHGLSFIDVFVEESDKTRSYIAADGGSKPFAILTSSRSFAIVKQFITAILFDSLELKHTCCKT